jgi:hypothetical protein
MKKLLSSIIVVALSSFALFAQDDKGQFSASYETNTTYYLKDDAVKARLKAELEYFGSEFAPQRHLFAQYGIETNNAS